MNEKFTELISGTNTSEMIVGLGLELETPLQVWKACFSSIWVKGVRVKVKSFIDRLNQIELYDEARLMTKIEITPSQDKEPKPLPDPVPCPYITNGDMIKFYVNPQFQAVPIKNGVPSKVEGYPSIQMTCTCVGDMLDEFFDYYILFKVYNGQAIRISWANRLYPDPDPDPEHVICLWLTLMGETYNGNVDTVEDIPSLRQSFEDSVYDLKDAGIVEQGVNYIMVSYDG